MTPKEKAKELYEYYDQLFRDNTRGVSIKEIAKQCSIKTVDEILKVAFYATNEIYDHYWEVINEIEKL